MGLPINDLNLLYTSLTSAPAEPSTGGGTSGSGTAETAPAIQSSGQASDSAYIGVEAAKSAAFAHAGLDTSQVTMGEVDFDYEDGCMVYELEFYANGSEYEYDIDALTGAVVKSQQESRGSAPSGGAPSGADIGEQGAKEAALAHAGVSQEQAESLRVKRDFDHGRVEYEVEFWVGATEYEYKIDGSTGAVLEQEQKTHHSNGNSADVGEQTALNTALAHAGVSQDQVYDLEVQRDRDDGRLEYEVEFKSAGYEYEYKIDARTGGVLTYEMDRD